MKIPRAETALPSPNQRAPGSALEDWIRALDYTRTLRKSTDITLPFLINELAYTYGDQPALLGVTEQYTYRRLAARSSQFARWAVAQGLATGDVVALLMPNHPDYVAIWLGLTRAGCAVALINTNLLASGLIHSIESAAARHLIVGNTLAPIVAAIAHRLSTNVQVWVHGACPSEPWARLDSIADEYSTAPLAVADRPLPSSSDRAFLIYTSGTTGLPKAVNVTHARVAEWSFWFAGMMNVQPTDRLYNCLPMYHSIGGIVAIGSMLVRGGSVVIRERFSATSFWDDVTDTDCTIFQYIGELCRYLTLGEPHPSEQQHRLRLVCGNGLQAAVWDEFQRRFNIPRILEFYAATEGMVSLYNCEGRAGAIGRIPPFLAHRLPVVLIRIDTETGQLLRDADGFCETCDVGEVGEAIGRIADGAGSPARVFDFYTDTAASTRKVLAGAFSTGDRWFRTGDLMRRDAAGYYYFVDRIGDTFRWRGENVATTEVATVLRACPGIVDAVVYGVAVPGNEGRAGMAAIITNGAFDLGATRAHLIAHLPAYACPLFVRVCVTFEVTSTFKLSKGNLVRQGYANSADPVWFNDRGTGRFIACDEALVLAIDSGAHRL